MKKFQEEQIKNFEKKMEDLKDQYGELWTDDIKEKMLEERRRWIS